jgi:hypothetical protein
MTIIYKTFRKIYGKPCWGLEYDPQLNLSMSFGDPILRIQEPKQSKSKNSLVRDLLSRRRVTVKGKWWLWIYCAYWKISLNGSRAATSSSSFLQISKSLAKLQGQVLNEVHVNPRTGATRFDFDLGGVLEVRRFERKSEDDLWMLYEPNGHVLTLRGDGRYSHGLGSKSDVELHEISADA